MKIKTYKTTTFPTFFIYTRNLVSHNKETKEKKERKKERKKEKKRKEKKRKKGVRE
jgi:hypothetical protein